MARLFWACAASKNCWSRVNPSRRRLDNKRRTKPCRAVGPHWRRESASSRAVSPVVARSSQPPLCAHSKRPLENRGAGNGLRGHRGMHQLQTYRVRSDVPDGRACVDADGADDFSVSSATWQRAPRASKPLSKPVRGRSAAGPSHSPPWETWTFCDAQRELHCQTVQPTKV